MTKLIIIVVDAVICALLLEFNYSVVAIGVSFAAGLIFQHIHLKGGK